ncbi:hypothetical protein CP974_28640 [Streptomyces fradiae ATCC 10745 = DSM 40063]|nr:hypothetical protein CP974_28640 [Streptomyces fradiae ATCC 10745 = DSM 40063]
MRLLMVTPRRGAATWGGRGGDVLLTGGAAHSRRVAWAAGPCRRRHVWREAVRCPCRRLSGRGRRSPGPRPRCGPRRPAPRAAR